MTQLADTERSKLWDRLGRRFGAGDSIFSEDEPADTCFLVQSGRVRLIKRMRQSERSLTVLSTGDLFGEDALLPEGTRRSASAVALTDLEVLALDRATFESLLADNAAIATRLVEQLVRRLRDSEEQLENAMLTDHPSRIVNTLLRLASRTPDAGPHLLEISPLELSSRVGLDVDAVKRAIQQLRDGGYLRIVDERIALPDLDALRRLYDLLGVKEEVRGGIL